MRWLLLADIHANVEALDAVLRDADARWGRLPLACAGDIVGYGPNPNECISRLRERNALCVAGNHDLMVLGRLSSERCAAPILRAVHWTVAELKGEGYCWLSELPTLRAVEDAFVLCHGSLTDVDEYIRSPEQARRQLGHLAAHFPQYDLVVHGHTHHAASLAEGRWSFASPGQIVYLAPGERSLLNPGSAGQSRDRSPLARYAVLDTETRRVAYAGVSYPVRACERKMRAAGLTTRLYVKPGDFWLSRFRRLVRRIIHKRF